MIRGSTRCSRASSGRPGWRSRSPPCSPPPIAGVLVLLIAVTLILLKLGFLLLLVVGPFFLLIGTHPGFGRVVALRWFEMLVGVLLKQAAVALVLSVLLYCVLADHGHQRRGAPVGAEDPHDRAGHRRGLHLPQAVPAPVLRRRLRHDRLHASGPRSASSATATAAREHPGRGGRRGARVSPPTGRPAGRRRNPSAQPLAAARAPPQAGVGARTGRAGWRGSGGRGEPGSRRRRAGHARAAGPGWPPGPGAWAAPRPPVTVLGRQRPR